jgi:hypothetical protein
VHDFTDDTADISLAFGKVETTEGGGTLAMLGVGLEDSSVAFALSADNSTH